VLGVCWSGHWQAAGRGQADPAPLSRLVSFLTLGWIVLPLECSAELAGDQAGPVCSELALSLVRVVQRAALTKDLIWPAALFGKFCSLDPLFSVFSRY